jgi:hypothetical protein
VNGPDEIIRLDRIDNFVNATACARVTRRLEGISDYFLLLDGTNDFPTEAREEAGSQIDSPTSWHLVGIVHPGR